MLTLLEKRNLYSANLTAMVFHGALFITILVLKYVNNSNYRIDMRLQYYVYNSTAMEISTDTTPALGNPVNGVDILISFSALSAGFHFLAAGPMRSWYETNIESNMNPLRWCEYSFSASLLYMVILALSGDRDMVRYTYAFIMMFSIMWLGYIQEKLLAQKKIIGNYKSVQKNPISLFGLVGAMSPTLLGWVLYLGVWIPYFVSVGYSFGQSPVAVPAVVYVSIALTFVLFTAFGIAQVMWLLDTIEYLTMEYIMIILSLISKTSLTLLVYAGLIANGSVVTTL